MDYIKIYESLMVRARGRTLTGYVEKHHIISKCRGGTDEPDNIVALTPEEHYLAHLLLIKIYPKHKGLLYAVKMMSGQHNNKSYGWVRRKISETGFTEEHRRNMSIAQLARPKRPKKVKSIKLPKKTIKEMSLHELEIYWQEKDKKRNKQRDSAIITALIYSITQ